MIKAVETCIGDCLECHRNEKRVYILSFYTALLRAAGAFACGRGHIARAHTRAHTHVYAKHPHSCIQGDEAEEDDSAKEDEEIILHVQHPPHPVGTAFLGFLEEHDEWMDEQPDEPPRVVALGGTQGTGSRDWLAHPASPHYRESKNGIFAAVPKDGTNQADAAKAADKFHADFEKLYARASPRRCRAASPPCFAPAGGAALRRAPECAAAAVGGNRRARRSQRHLRCITRCLAYRAQEGEEAEGEEAEVRAAGAHPRAPPSTRAHCGTVRPRTLAWPTRGLVRRACDGALVEYSE